MPWNDETNFENADKLLEYVLSLPEGLACRGQADSDWLLHTSLDRILEANTDYAARLAEERAVLEKFRILTRNYFGAFNPLEAGCLHGSHANAKVSALTLLQHYGAPTRLLDWTRSPWVALYFAAIDQQDKGGALWWFDQKSFEREVGGRWRKEYYDMEQYRSLGPDGQIDLDATAFSTNGPPWITKLYHRVPFHRIQAQQAFFTVAGRLGIEHGSLIADVLTEGSYGRILVPALWKQKILDRLCGMNIHSRSLDYTGADRVGHHLTQDLRRAHCNGSED